MILGCARNGSGRGELAGTGVFEEVQGVITLRAEPEALE